MLIADSLVKYPGKNTGFLAEFSKLSLAIFKFRPGSTGTLLFDRHSDFRVRKLIIRTASLETVPHASLIHTLSPASTIQTPPLAKMSKQAVFTESAPKPLAGIYSQAIVANGFVYCSGQVPANPATGQMAEGDIQAHTVRAPTSNSETD